ncbi:hypothetical protein [Paenibacillus sp. J2TS4]|uniref:hypothetical protein n=1 Tax=Paenibacillus sp. J2TS4 TaxID=2807194 RepID=UPI001B2085CF|nr:hypothetical protein [Paenibacillus sp. J2TS4]GIP30975.1 hypothetical protein J2TS4_01850 [Paenibacillus sp. J2TS4]
MAAVLHDEGKADHIKISGNPSIEAALTAIIHASLLPVENEKLKVQVNPVAKKGMTITYSLGVMLFKFITAGSALAGILIMDRKSGRQRRIFMSGIRRSGLAELPLFLYTDFALQRTGRKRTYIQMGLSRAFFHHYLAPFPVLLR